MKVDSTLDPLTEPFASMIVQISEEICRHEAELRTCHDNVHTMRTLTRTQLEDCDIAWENLTQLVGLWRQFMVANGLNPDLVCLGSPDNLYPDEDDACSGC